MKIMLILLSLACALLLGLLLRLYADIGSVCRQLEEIARGSHMELTAATRQRPLLNLCRILNRIFASLEESRIRYERSQKQLKRNITNLAHDIRTPLTGASGYLQMARECGDFAKRDHYLLTAGRRLEELEDMLEKLFLYTKLTNEDFLFSRESLKPVQILPLLSDCLLSLYTQFEEKGISPEIRFASEGFRALADEEALRRIFLNLLQNALLHGEGNLTITQSNSAAPPLPETPSNDTGHTSAQTSPAWQGCLCFENRVPRDISIHPKQLFDLFYKADNARRKGSSGLGLFIVKELMHRMGGDAAAKLNGNLLQITLFFPQSVQSAAPDPPVS
ncbi:MAG: HAMP domain-containing histidine kinase [Lachnospiraceae bacterium]|jgi:signal transduction histidine kinase|nr:HAMP domain-containing histidine kinase [Lachnospiraceae bacterium]